VDLQCWGRGPEGKFIGKEKEKNMKVQADN